VFCELRRIYPQYKAPADAPRLEDIFVTEDWLFLTLTGLAFTKEARITEAKTDPVESWNFMMVCKG